MNIRNVLHNTVKKYGSKPALIFNDKTLSFSELEEKTLKLANVLQSKGIHKGDKVGIYLPNCPEFVSSYLAIFYLGAVAVPLDYMLKEEELVSCLSHAEAKVLIALPKEDVDLKSISQNVSSLKTVFSIAQPVEGTENLSSLWSTSSVELKDVAVSDDDPSMIMYTSGTTGAPKGILLTYKHLEGSPEAMKYFVDLTDKDTKLAAIPMSHIGGFIYLQNCVVFGITLVLMGRFNPYEFLELVQKYKVTCFHIVPPMYNAILTLKQIEKYDLSSLRWVVVFGAPSSPEIMERFHKYCPNAKLLNGWGMTETCPPNTVTPLGSTNIASVGKPAPNCKIKIVDESGCEVKTGEIGEIVIDGWILMKEYYKDPQETVVVKRKDGLYTGDLGKFDAEGFLYIIGRKKEMIKVGGQIVYEPEVEAVLYKHEAVAECAVIGVPDKMKGEAVKAFVVLKSGANVAAEDIRYFAREHLANFKVPQIVEIREDLPKNRTGKIDKALLKNEKVVSSR